MGRNRMNKGVWVLAALLAAAGTEAQDGPGIPKVTYAAGEVGSLLFHTNGFRDRVPKAFMFKGYLVVSEWRGRRITLWDIGNPKAPKLVSEATGAINGDEHGVFQYGTKLLVSGAVYELANPLAPKHLGRFQDFFLSIQPAFQYPYLYDTRTYDAAGKSNTLSIIDYTNPAAPKKVKDLDVQSLVGFATGSLLVMGNLLIVASGDVYKGVAAFDISDPLDPKLLGTNKTGFGMYIAQSYGPYIVTTGPKNEGGTNLFDIRDPENIKLSLSVKVSGMGDYAHFQNGYMYGGFYQTQNFVKADMKTLATVLNRKTLGTKTSRYVMPFGNMVFVGDYGIEGSGQPGAHGALFVSDAAPDNVPPSVLYVNPPNGATAQAVTSRMALALDEDIDNRDLDSGKVVIRPLGGAPLAGTWTFSAGVANFTPSKPLDRGVTYEIVVAPGSVRDWSGNRNVDAFVSRFSTGTTIVTSIGGPRRVALDGGRRQARLVIRRTGNGLDASLAALPAYDLTGARLRHEP